MWWDTIVVGSGVRGATMEGAFGRRPELYEVLSHDGFVIAPAGVISRYPVYQASLPGKPGTGRRGRPPSAKQRTGR